jgi:hypothetical protein
MLLAQVLKIALQHNPPRSSRNSYLVNWRASSELARRQCGVVARAGPMVSTFTDRQPLIQQQGTEDGKLHAAQRADEMLTKGDLDGDRTWRLIFKAIGEPASTEIPPGATSH